MEKNKNIERRLWLTFAFLTNPFVMIYALVYLMHVNFFAEGQWYLVPNAIFFITTCVFLGFSSLGIIKEWA